jgi:hypothetical protein
MKIQIEIPDIRQGEGLKAVWEPGFEIFVSIKDDATIISANKAGLISLARHLLVLSLDVFPIGNHWHFDDLNSLEESSSELIINKI